MVRKGLLFFILLSCMLGSARALAREKSNPSGLELGVKMGLPVFMVPTVGLWRPFDTPILIRVGSILLTSEADLGWVFDNKGTYRQYVAGTAGAAAWSDGSLRWYGLKYGGIYSVVFFEAGVANSATGNSAYRFLSTDNSAPKIYPIFQMGIVTVL